MAADNKRHRRYAIQGNYYFDTHDADGNLKNNGTEQQWRDYKVQMFEQAHQDGISIAYIFHDDDKFTSADKSVKAGKDKAGDPKPLHYHAVIEFPSNKLKSSTWVIKYFNLSQPPRVVGGAKGGRKGGATQLFLLFLYLTHLNQTSLNLGKYPYYQHPDTHPVTVLGFDGKSYRELIKDPNADKNGVSKGTNKHAPSYPGYDDYRISVRQNLKLVPAYFSRLIATGQLNLDETQATIDKLYHQCATDAGMTEDTIWQNDAKEFWTDNRKTFHDDWLEHTHQVAQSMIKGTWNKKTIYIGGPGGTGKSSLAKHMAMLIDGGRVPHMASVSNGKTTYDFTSLYKGENTTIMNDADPNSFQLREALSVFDPWQYSSVSSRNKDTNWIVHQVFITYSSPLILPIHSTDTGWVDDLMRFSAGGSKYYNGNRLLDRTCHAYQVDQFQLIRRFYAHLELERTEVDVDPALHRRSSIPVTRIKVYLSNGFHFYDPFDLVGSVDCDDVKNSKKMDDCARQVLDLLKIPVKKGVDADA